MVFVIRGLHSPWKMPISYFLPDISVKHLVLSELLVKAVTQLFKYGFIVKALIWDPDASNVASYKDLKITKKKSHIYKLKIEKCLLYLMFHISLKI